MSRGFKFTLTILAVLSLSVFLTPVIHALLPVFKFEKIFDRLIMVFFITAAALFVRFRREAWKTYGFDFSVAWKRLFVIGFLSGALAILFITVPEVVFGPRYLRTPILISDCIQRFFKGLLTGVTVGIVEEFFFRGFIFVHLERAIRKWPGILITSIFYSAVHFLNNGQIFIPKNPQLGDAFRLLFGVLEPFAHQTDKVLPEFFGLFLFGILLNIAFCRTRSLFLSIGIHAGAVFCIKFQNSFIRKGPDVYDPIFGGTPHYDGLFEWFVLVLFCFAVYGWKEASSKGTPFGSKRR